MNHKISKHKYEFFLWSYSVTTLIDGDCKNQNREFSEIYCLENLLISLQSFFCALFWRNSGGDMGNNPSSALTDTEKAQT